jgi:primary-amine oxidase
VDIEKAEVVKKEFLEGKHSYIDAAYMQDVERACLADKRIKKEVEKLKLPEGATVVVEPWAYATDGMSDTSERTTMVSSHLPRRALIRLTGTVLVLHATLRQP